MRAVCPRVWSACVYVLPVWASAAIGQVLPPDATDAYQNVGQSSECSTRSTDAKSSGCSCIPALTEVVISIDADVSSTRANTGDFFPISLAEPIVLDGTVVVPAGASGQGQVVHARHRGWGGAAGELILAARHIEWEGTRIALRTMRISQAGRDGTALATVATVAAGAVDAFVTGRSADVVKGQRATARLASDVLIDPAEHDLATQVAATEPARREVNSGTLPNNQQEEPQ